MGFLPTIIAMQLPVKINFINSVELVRKILGSKVQKMQTKVMIKEFHNNCKIFHVAQLLPNNDFEFRTISNFKSGKKLFLSICFTISVDGFFFHVVFFNRKQLSVLR